MENSKVVTGVLQRQYWKKGLNASAAAYEVCSVEGKEKLDTKKWPPRFRSGDTDIKPGLGHPSNTSDEPLRQAFKDAFSKHYVHHSHEVRFSGK